MDQPGPDEISQGMDHRRSRLAGRLAGFGHARLRGLIVAGCAVVLVIAGVTTAAVVRRPSYPHAWCGPLLTVLHVRGETDLEYAAAVAGVGRRDHAPVGRLVSDLRDYSVASSGLLQYPDDRVRSGNAAGMMSTFALVTGDLRALNRSCGQPAGAYQGDSF
jgi:hypothetical protein